MFFIYLLKEWFTCSTSWFDATNTFRGIGIFGVEPESPRPAMPDAPPMHPCPDQRDGPTRPFF